MTDSLQGGVGYILRKFPVLSETFILNEILALEERGVPVHIFSLERPNDPRFHENLSKLKASITYLPQSFFSRSLWLHNYRRAQRDLRRYLSASVHALTHRGFGLFERLLQGAYIANHANRLGLKHLHSHFANRPTTVAFFASWMTGIPYSFTAHAADIFRKRVNARALVKKIEKAKFVITISDFNKSFLAKLAGPVAGKIVRLYNGIDLDRFVPNGGLKAEPFTILCVSRLVEKKGLTVLVDACRLLRERNTAFRSWIVGSGELQEKLQEQINAGNLQNHVQLLGPQPQGEVLKRYHSAHLYVLPCVVGSDGNREGLPVSIVEALACGLPVITTPVTGIPEVVRHGENGLLVAQGNALALCDAIESVIHDRRLYDNFQAGARSSVESTFDIRQTAKTLQHLFQQGTA